MSFIEALTAAFNIDLLIIVLLTCLFASIVTILIYRKMIWNQNIKLKKKNIQLKRILKNVTSISVIRDMAELFDVFVLQLRELLLDPQLQIVSLIEQDEGYVLDSELYITEEYKRFHNMSASEVDFNYLDVSVLETFGKSNDQIGFFGNFVLVKYDSSFDRQGLLYIETKKADNDREYIHLYIANILMSLQTVIANIKRNGDKSRLFVALGELIEKRDIYVANHVKRVSEATKLLAKACGYEGEALANIVISSSIHDIGKIYVPDYILNKPGRLTEEEFEIIKTHATDNFQIMDDVDDKLSKSVHDVVRFHHENWNGTGYPERLSGEAIPMDARIVSVIDVFEALTHERPYKSAWPREEAINYLLENRSTKFDANVIDAFMRVEIEILNVFDKYGNTNS